MRTLARAYLSSLCMELSLILKSGIPLSDGVEMLAANDPKNAPLLNGIAADMAAGGNAFDAFSRTGVFPKYMLDMVALGERTGRSESVLAALAEYYERRERLAKTVKSAVAYPAVLLVMMLFVAAVLIIEVLPIFNDVFRQLGGTMSRPAAALMHFGESLKANWYVPCIIIAVIAAFAVAAFRVKPLRAWFARVSFSTAIGRKLSTARFASAMAMTVSGGLNMDEAIELAERMTDNPEMRRRVAKCRELSGEGVGFGEAAAKAGLFSPLYTQMLAVGVRTGAGDTVLAEIARRTELEVEQATDSLVAKIEPTLVVIMSALVGLVLISVMLPLMSIMSEV